MIAKTSKDISTASAKLGRSRRVKGTPRNIFQIDEPDLNEPETFIPSFGNFSHCPYCKINPIEELSEIIESSKTINSNLMQIQHEQNAKIMMLQQQNMLLQQQNNKILTKLIEVMGNKSFVGSYGEIQASEASIVGSIDEIQASEASFVGSIDEFQTYEAANVADDTTEAEDITEAEDALFLDSKFEVLPTFDMEYEPISEISEKHSTVNMTLDSHVNSSPKIKTLPEFKSYFDSQFKAIVPEAIHDLTIHEIKSNNESCLQLLNKRLLAFVDNDQELFKKYREKTLAHRRVTKSNLNNSLNFNKRNKLMKIEIN